MKTTSTKSIQLPVALCKRVEAVAREKKLPFNKAVSFLLEKVNAPARLSFSPAR